MGGALPGEVPFPAGMQAQGWAGPSAGQLHEVPLQAKNL